MVENIPEGPWGNPKLEEGRYEALVENIRHVEFGEANGAMLELTFRLGTGALRFMSRLYLPATFPDKCQHRLWYLCQSLRLEGYELMENPDVAVGRRLVLDVTTVHPTKANQGQAYSDVKRFLPPATNEQVVLESAKNVTG